MVDFMPHSPIHGRRVLSGGNQHNNAFLVFCLGCEIASRFPSFRPVIDFGDTPLETKTARNVCRIEKKTKRVESSSPKRNATKIGQNLLVDNKNFFRDIGGISSSSPSILWVLFTVRLLSLHHRTPIALVTT